jgi:hypothetical protein
MASGSVCASRFAKIAMRASTVNLEYLGTSADMDSAQMRDCRRRPGAYRRSDRTNPAMLGKLAGIHFIHCLPAHPLAWLR